MTTAPPARRLYGRRLGRPLKVARADVIDTLLPRLAIPESGALDPAALFGCQPDELWLEIGFGNGEHIAGLLRRDPGLYMLAAEPFINGMAAFLKDIKDEPEIQNRVRVRMDDARPLVETLPDACLDGIYVLNPDPWPKLRHHKRRIISQENLTGFARVMKPGARLVMATDVDGLAEWMVTEASRHPAFAWTAAGKADWQAAPADWLPTRYEQKGIAAGRRQTYLIFQRRLAGFDATGSEA